MTEEEFAAVFSQLPEETQRQYSNPQGKSAFAEEMVRYKLLEQEARRLGVDHDPKVAAVVSADRMNILASAVAQKLVAKPTEQAIRAFYDKNKSSFDSVEVSHSDQVQTTTHTSKLGCGHLRPMTGRRDMPVSSRGA